MTSSPGPSPFTDYKESVRTASTGDIVLNDLPDEIDGVPMSYGDRFLAKDQDDAAENGIYVYLGEDETAEITTGGRDGQLTSGALIVVEEGDTQGDTLWILTTDDPIEVGETAIEFEQVGADAPPVVDLLPLNNTWTGVNTFANIVSLAGGHAGNFNMGGNRIVNLDSNGPVNPNDAANKQYVDDNMGVQLGDNNTWTGQQQFNLPVALGPNAYFAQHQATDPSDLVLQGAINGEPQPRIRLRVGEISWGDGTSSPDTFLQRDSFANALITTGRFTANTMYSMNEYVAQGSGSSFRADNLSAGNVALTLKSATGGFQVRGSGQLEWTDGVNPADTLLYRDGVGILKTDTDLTVGGHIYIGGVGATETSVFETDDSVPVLEVQQTGDAFPSIKVWSNSIELSDGTTDPDTVGALSGGAAFIELSTFGSNTLNITSSSGDVQIMSAAGGSVGVGVGPGTASVSVGTSTNDVGLYGVTPVPQAAAIPDASGGVVIDTEARAAINALLQAMRDLGPIAP